MGLSRAFPMADLTFLDCEGTLGMAINGRSHSVYHYLPDWFIPLTCEKTVSTGGWGTGYQFGQLFAKYDTDGDGRLGRADFERMINGMHDARRTYEGGQSRNGTNVPTQAGDAVRLLTSMTGGAAQAAEGSITKYATVNTNSRAHPPQIASLAYKVCQHGHTLPFRKTTFTHEAQARTDLAGNERKRKRTRRVIVLTSQLDPLNRWAPPGHHKLRRLQRHRLAGRRLLITTRRQGYR